MLHILKKSPNLLAAFVLAGILASGCSSGDRRTASRRSAGIAPDPAMTEEAVLQVYGAGAWGWRGRVARRVPELNLNLPFSAIGSGYID